MAKLNHALLQSISVLHLALAVVSPGAEARPYPNVRLGSEASAALKFFPWSEASSAEALLSHLRPPRLGPELRARAIARLPRDGELAPSLEERAQLTSADLVLALHDRTGAVELKVIDVYQAFLGLYERSVILISRPALKLLSGPEVQALVAHELAHDYFWEEYDRAVTARDKRAVREIELRCDAVAILTLRAMKLDPEALGSALAKLSGSTCASAHPRMQTITCLMPSARAFTPRYFRL